MAEPNLSTVRWWSDAGAGWWRGKPKGHPAVFIRAKKRPKRSDFKPDPVERERYRLAWERWAAGETTRSCEGDLGRCPKKGIPRWGGLCDEHWAAYSKTWRDKTHPLSKHKTQRKWIDYDDEVTKPKPKPKAGNDSRFKRMFDLDDADAIRAELAGGASVSATARKWGVGRELIYDIRDYKKAYAED